MSNNLIDKAIDIKGKKYVLVSDRVLYFNETFKEGCIQTELIKHQDKQIIIKATVYPEGIQGRYFTGYSQAIEGDGYINKTSALENAETSAVGRALAMMGIGVIDSIASVDEIKKAGNHEKIQKTKKDDDYPVEFIKPTFLQEDFDRLKLKKDIFKDGVEAVKTIKDKYTLTPTREQNILDLYK